MNKGLQPITFKVFAFLFVYPYTNNKKLIHYKKICICIYAIYITCVLHIVNYMSFGYVVDCTCSKYGEV